MSGEAGYELSHAAHFVTLEDTCAPTNLKLFNTRVGRNQRVAGHVRDQESEVTSSVTAVNCKVCPAVGPITVQLQSLLCKQNDGRL